MDHPGAWTRQAVLAVSGLTMDQLIGERLRTARCQSGMTLEQLAAITSINLFRLASGERGDSRFTAQDILQLTRALKIPVTALVCVDPPD